MTRCVQYWNRERALGDLGPPFGDRFLRLLHAVPADPDLSTAASAIETAKLVVDAAVGHLAANGEIETDQVVAYNLAHAAAAVENARAIFDYGANGEVEARIACAFVADAVYDVAARLLGREAEWGTVPGALDAALPFVRSCRSPGYLAALCGEQGARHLDADFKLARPCRVGACGSSRAMRRERRCCP